MRGAWLFAALALSCRGEAPGNASTGGAPSKSAGVAAAVVPSAQAAPKVETGAELVARFQCLRCHDDESSAPRGPARDDEHCVHCHRAILEGTLHAREPTTTSRWKRNVEPLGDVPSLVAIGKRLRRSWIAGFLVAPYDLRPHLEPTMPRLAVTREQANAIASYYAGDEHPSADERSDGDIAKGRALIEQKGCGDCHVVTGAPSLPGGGSRKAAPSSRAFRLAPDLRFVRERYEKSALVAWLRSPRAVKPDTLMPETGLGPDEARHVAAYLLGATLAPPPTAEAPARLPVLERAVSFAEVDARVFHKMCWHCHSEPDFAIGNGGPGNTGGFGFAPRGLNLASYEGIASGAFDEHGERRSVFTLSPDGEPRLLSALFARQREVAGLTPGAGSLRGMPLGLPALEPADVQLVETWIAQGRPR